MRRGEGVCGALCVWWESRHLLNVIGLLAVMWCKETVYLQDQVTDWHKHHGTARQIGAALVVYSEFIITMFDPDKLLDSNSDSISDCRLLGGRTCGREGRDSPGVYNVHASF